MKVYDISAWLIGCILGVSVTSLIFSIWAEYAPIGDCLLSWWLVLALVINFSQWKFRINN